MAKQPRFLQAYPCLLLLVDALVVLEVSDAVVLGQPGTWLPIAVDIAQDRGTLASLHSLVVEEVGLEPVEDLRPGT